LSQHSRDTFWDGLRNEWFLIAGICTLGVFLATPVAGAAWPFAKAVLFAWLFAAILLCVFRVVHHAGELAERYGEPYGSMILTFSLLIIEIALIASVMLTGSKEPTLARDTMFAGIMLTMNGVVGVVLLVGGLRHFQQEYNLEGARAYLAALIPLAVIGLVLPNFTGTGTGALSTSQEFIIGITTVVFYAIFLAIQTMRHRSFFETPSQEAAASLGEQPAQPSLPFRPVLHFVLLCAGLVAIVALSRELAEFVDYGIHRLAIPAAFGGIVIATLTLLPESLSALKDAMQDKLQHSVNVFLGGALATIGLTVPCVLLIGAMTGETVILGLKGPDMVLLLLTLFVSSLTFGGVRTNVLQGAVHLLLFVLYLILILDP
jgi:Ca2+:H+ antiporter